MPYQGSSRAMNLRSKTSISTRYTRRLADRYFVLSPPGRTKNTAESFLSYPDLSGPLIDRGLMSTEVLWDLVIHSPPRAPGYWRVLPSTSPSTEHKRGARPEPWYRSAPRAAWVPPQSCNPIEASPLPIVRTSRKKRPLRNGPPTVAGKGESARSTKSRRGHRKAA